MNIRKLSLGLTAALALGFAIPQAQAGVLLEPYLGYHMGKDKDAVDTDTNGMVFGGRVGYSQLGFAAGLDIMQGAWTHKSKPSVDTTPSDMGLFVAYEFPVLLRAYAVYNLQSNLGIKFANGNDTYKGNGFKIGVGITTLPFVAVNLEYRTSTFTKNNTGAMNPSYKQDTYGLTVSLPLDL